MGTNPSCKTKLPLFVDKKQLLTYSLYLSLGSLALFIALTGTYTTLQAILWKYTTKYIVNSALLSLVAYTACILLIGSCYLLVKSNPLAKNTGFLGCSLFIIYPFTILLFEPMMPYSFTYLTFLCIPAIIILIVSLFLSKKQ